MRPRCVPHLNFAARLFITDRRHHECGVAKDGSAYTDSLIEITKKYDSEYAGAGRQRKSFVLVTVTKVTGWNRGQARQQMMHREAARPKV